MADATTGEVRAVLERKATALKERSAAKLLELLEPEFVYVTASGRRLRPERAADHEALDDVMRCRGEAPRELLQRLVQAQDDGAAFPESYKDSTTPDEAVADVGRIERLDDSGGIAVHLYAAGDDPRLRFLRVVSTASRPLTEVLPMLTALGVQVLDDRPQDVTLMDGSTRHISDFALSLHDAEMWDDDARAAAFEQAFLAIWSGAAEGDSLNSLVLRAGVDWRDVVILRAIGAYLRQIGSAFSMEYTDQALTANPTLAAGLVRVFRARFDPDTADGGTGYEQVRDELLRALDDVPSLHLR